METEEVRKAIAKRFVEAVDLLIKEDKVLSYTAMASFLGLGKASISDMKAGRSGVDVVHIYNTIITYSNINADYIISGKGDLIKKDNKALIEENDKLQKELAIRDNQIAKLEKENDIRFSLIHAYELQIKGLKDNIEKLKKTG